MKKIIAAISLFSCLSAQAAWNINDVSILFDLPKSSEELSYLIPADSIISASIYDSVKPMVIGDVDMPKDEYKAIRVVGARLDPCFNYIPTGNKCYAQIRLVWQPIGRNKAGEYVAMDAGFHTFHELSTIEFKTLLARVDTLKTRMEKAGVKTQGIPLDIHPALKNPKTRLAFNTEMKSIIQSNATKKNLSRVTFMRLFTPAIWWVFGGLEIKNGEAIDMKIARLGENEKVINFFNDDFNEVAGMRGAIVPELVNDSKADDLTELLKNYSYTFSSPEGKAYVKKSFETLDKVDNPSHFNSENMDCVHCHMSTPTRAWLMKKDPALVKANSKTRFKFSGANLANTSGHLMNTKSLRLFGHFGTKTAIGQRVINESAEVVRILNSK